MRHLLPSAILFMIVLFFSACGGGGGGGGDTPQSILTGTWLYTYTATQCEDRYTFNSDGTWSGTSLNAVSSGTYLLTENTGSGKHTLAVTVTADNGQFDCAGDFARPVPITKTIYIAFPSGTEMEWYDKQTDAAPMLTLTKQ